MGIFKPTIVHSEHWYKKFLGLFGAIYDTLYDNGTDRKGDQYANLIEEGNQLLKDSDFSYDLGNLIRMRGDIFTSDREVVALVLTNKIMAL